MLGRWRRHEGTDYAAARGKSAVQDALFEVRFGINLDNEWRLDQYSDQIDTLWDLLEDLPDVDIEGSTTLKSINLTQAGASVYNNATHEIDITAADTEAARRHKYIPAAYADIILG